MSIRRRILIPMIVLSVVSCIVVFVFAIVLFNRELNVAMRNKIDVAVNVVEKEIQDLLVRAGVASIGMASNQDLIETLADQDRERIILLANTLKSMTQIDFCNIIDNEGYVITRTHEPTRYGDNISNQPHVGKALEGLRTTNITTGAVIELGVYAGAPIFDHNMDLLGAVSLGFRLDVQDFPEKMKELTGCEITIFKADERVSSTAVNADGSFALGTKANEDISKMVLAGGEYFGNIELYGQDMLGHYSPIYGVNDTVVGMLFVGFYTAEDTSKVIFFIIAGAIATLAVLGICILIARKISVVIENRLEGMMDEIREHEEEVLKAHEVNELQLTKLDLVIKATKIGLWDMEVNQSDPVNPANAFIWSDTFREMLGYKNEEDFPNLFSSWSDRLHPDDKEKALNTFALHILDVTGKTPYNVEYRLQRKDGEYSYFRASGETIRDKKGNAIRVAGALIDITDDKKTQLKNELQLTLMNSVVKATKIALWDMEVVTGDPVNPNNKFLWTDEFRKLMGYSSEEDFPNVLNSWSDRLHPDDKERALDAFARHMLDVTGKTPFDIEYQLLKKNNEYSYYRATGESVRDKNGNAIHVAGALIDITDDKKALIEIERQRAEAEAANRTKSTFLANMSHEIRTPMNSIIGFAELAQYGDIPIKTRDYLTNIQDSAQWLLNIINDILDISKIESGKIDLETIPFELPDIFAHCQSAIIPKTVEKGIMLYCYAEPSIGKKLLGDPIRLRQVIMNLLSNSVKFTKSGTVKLLASLIESSDTRAKIQFEIKDSGIGMTSEQVDRIFEPFKQADDSITRRYGGTGLGLTITKNIIELMGGTLKVESAPNIGSRFSFELDFELVDKESDKVTEKIMVNDFEQPTFDGEILICEDNSLNQQVICDHLARVGLKTVVAYNGKEGVNAVAERVREKTKQFDLIFMDIHMPIMDGLEAAEKISELGVTTPIVALTANVMSNDLELYKASGMSETVGKPFTANELWRCLIKFLPVVEYTAINRTRQDEEEEKTQKLLKTNFVRNNQTTFKDFLSCVKEGDIKTAHRLAHTVKSNAGQIGEKRLQSAAAVAESMLADGTNQLNKEHIHNFESELVLVLNELAPLLDETRIMATFDSFDKEKAQKVIEKLEPLLKDKDTSCMEMVDEIAESIPDAEELIRLVEGCKFRQAIASLKNLKESLGL